MIRPSIYFFYFYIRFPSECYLDVDDQVTCRCPQGYEGTYVKNIFEQFKKKIRENTYIYIFCYILKVEDANVVRKVTKAIH